MRSNDRRGRGKTPRPLARASAPSEGSGIRPRLRVWHSSRNSPSVASTKCAICSSASAFESLPPSPSGKLFVEVSHCFISTPSLASLALFSSFILSFVSAQKSHARKGPTPSSPSKAPSIFPVLRGRASAV